MATTFITNDPMLTLVLPNTHFSTLERWKAELTQQYEGIGRSDSMTFLGNWARICCKVVQQFTHYDTLAKYIRNNVLGKQLQNLDCVGITSKQGFIQALSWTSIFAMKIEFQWPKVTEQCALISWKCRWGSQGSIVCPFCMCLFWSVHCLGVQT